MRRPTTVLLLIVPMFAQADAVSRKAGRAVGEFGAGVAEVLGEGLNQGISSIQPQWITIAPRSKPPASEYSPRLSSSTASVSATTPVSRS